MVPLLALHPDPAPELTNQLTNQGCEEALALLNKAEKVL